MLLFRCVENQCFKGPDSLADIAVFYSVPIIIHRFTSILDATLNSRTGRRFVNVATTGTFTSKGRTRNPRTGEVIDNEENENAGVGNPMYQFSLADDAERYGALLGAIECRECFNCKVSSQCAENVCPTPKKCTL